MPYGCCRSCFTFFCKWSESRSNRALCQDHFQAEDMTCGVLRLGRSGITILLNLYSRMLSHIAFDMLSTMAVTGALNTA